MLLACGSRTRSRGFPNGASNISDAGHDDLLSPARDTRYRDRPPARRTNRVESVLPSLQIMGSAVPDAPLRSRHVHTHIRRTVDEGVSRPIELSHSLHSDPHTPWPPACRRCRPSYSHPRFPLPQSREFEHTFRVQRFGRRSGLPRPIPRIVTHHQIAPPGIIPRSTLRGFWSHLFIPPSRGFRGVRFRLLG